MSILNDVSILLTPNAFKASKLYSVVPSSGAADMSVVRATIATRVNTSRLIENVAANVPRLNYDTVGGCPSILIEPQRTNILTNSEEFSSINWAATNATVSINATTAPDGTSSADKIVETVTDGGHYLLQSRVNIPSVFYTGTIYMKAAERNFGWIEFVGSATGYFVVNLTTGAVTSNTMGITPIVTLIENGWVKISYSKIMGVGVSIGVLLGTAFNSITRTYPGSITSGIYVWGAQLEQGAYPTSYIPTTTAAVQRNFDDVYKTGVSSLLNPSEGTLFLESSTLANDDTFKLLSINDGTDYNQLSIQFKAGSIRFVSRGLFSAPSTITEFRYTLTFPDTTVLSKCVLKWGPLGIFAFVNGTKYTLTYVTGDISGTAIPTALNQFGFKLYYGDAYLFGKVKNVGIWKTSLTDTQCVQLTTI